MSSRTFVKPFSVKTYRTRRNDLIHRLSKIEKEFTCLFWSGSECVRNYDSHFLFRADSDFLYLTGFSEPETMILMQRTKKGVQTAIGVRPRDLSSHRGSEIWEGERVGVERAPKILGFDKAFNIHHLESVLKEWLPQAPCLFWTFNDTKDWDRKIFLCLEDIHSRNRKASIVHTFRDPRITLHEMRKKKDKAEIEIMRRSAEIAARGHIRAMKTARPGLFEYQVQAEVEREFKRGGAPSPSYNSIVATGPNACTLHYHSNDTQLKDGEILLIDAGAEYDGYASDITRSFPTSGKFSATQKEVYSWVLKAQLAAIRAARVGAPFTAPHAAAVRVICEGLSKMKIIKQSPKQILKKGLWKAYMPHGTSHWLGLDVHDRGIYKESSIPTKDVKLEVGHALTVEPGLYFRKNDTSIPARWRGIGIRIEDDIVVTKKGADVLSSSCPKTIEDIERVCGVRL